MLVKKDVDKDVAFIETQLYQNILDKIKVFLVEAVSNVVSIAFKFMCKGELEEK